ncbi:DNA-binding transcriptional regulator, Lrp family [Syntrophus gentianae]|uniref:siroheme decarboxylase n=1 Tax=Syntrophus gentianae TaxID=43775 RepID=A0A1H8AK49_9BACT|nr:AsnC family transcriptional regulator [Syntrophus gentianae]SEM70159.1 DNA-binding transcriptional regulator, Lrp family [Syntrophus gentianae]
MDILDKSLLNLLQTDFPLAAEPFRAVAEKLGISENEVLSRIFRLKEKGVIRRIGAVLDSGKLGFVSRLCAARVPEDRIARFVDRVNALPGVTHNYGRNHPCNIWFTLIAPSEEELERTIEGISRDTGVREILTFRAVRTFKIDAKFLFDDALSENSASPSGKREEGPDAKF